jgi:hypothetical protein
LTVASTPAGVTYSVSPAGPYHGGQSVTVTATINNPATDLFVAPAPSGWTFVDASHETYAVTFAPSPTCGSTIVVLAPVSPTFTNPGCTSTGLPVAPTITLATGPAGVTYAVSPAGPYVGGQTVTVTATIDNPAVNTFATPTAGGWTFVDSQHETLTHTFGPANQCSGTGGEKAVAVVPLFKDSVCVSGELTQATYTLPATNGVTYSVNRHHKIAGTYVAPNGSTITVRIRAIDGFRLTTASRVVHHFTAPVCQAVAPARQAVTPPLASTGVPAGEQVAAGAFAVLGGVGLMLLGRRRRRRVAS